MDLTKEQKSKLVLAIKDYRRSLTKAEAAQNDVQEKLKTLQNCSGISGNGETVLTASMTALGEAYIKDLDGVE